MSSRNKFTSGTSATERFSFATQQTAECMLGELESQRLEVCLVPARTKKHEDHMIRVALSKNPKWYSDFCSKYLQTCRKRKKVLSDTAIKRNFTVRALTNIIQNRKTQPSCYIVRLLTEIDLYQRKHKISLASSNPF